MLLFYLLAAVAVGVLAAAAGLQAGFPGWAVLGCYVLGGAGALAMSAAVDRWVERTRVRQSDPRTSEQEADRRGAILFLLVSLLALAVALLASAMGLVPARTEGRSAFLAGLISPTFGLDHLLALLWLGLWAGRLGAQAIWALPTLFLCGMLGGLGLGLGAGPGPVLEPIVHLLVGTSLLLLIGTALVPVRLPLPHAASSVGLMGGCHGYLHALELGAGPAHWFGLGALLSAAVLAGTGAALGRVLDRPA
jgi:urease accessory protein